MKIALLLLALALTTACQAVDAWAEERAASGTLSSARQAMLNGEYERALPLYETVLANPQHEGDVHAEAMLNIAFVRLSERPDLRDVGAARDLIAQVQAKHPDYRAPEIRMILDLLDAGERLRGQASGSAAEVARLTEELARKNEMLKQVTDTVLDGR